MEVISKKYSVSGLFLPVNIAKVINCLMQRTITFVVSECHIRCNNTEMVSHSHRCLSDFSWREQATVHRLHKLKVTLQLEYIFVSKIFGFSRKHLISTRENSWRCNSVLYLNLVILLEFDVHFSMVIKNKVTWAEFDWREGYFLTSLCLSWSSGGPEN